MLLGGEDPPLDVGRRRRRDDARDQAHRAVDEDARRLAVRRRGGSGRRTGPASSRSTFARRMASEFAQPAWPSTRVSQTGRSGATASSTAAVGNAPPGQRLWSQFRPMIQTSPGGASIRSLTLPGDLLERRPTPRRSSSSVTAPSDSIWPWASIRPGRRERLGPVDDPRRRASTALDLVARPHGDDRAARARPGLGPGLRRVAGPDPADLDDQIGRLDPLGRMGGSRRASQHEKSAQEQTRDRDGGPARCAAGLAFTGDGPRPQPGREQVIGDRDPEQVVEAERPARGTR